MSSMRIMSSGPFLLVARWLFVLSCTPVWPSDGGLPAGQLVASGYGLTTVPAVIALGVRVLPVRGGPEERRRVIVAHLPHRLPEPALRVIEALRAAATDTEAS